MNIRAAGRLRMAARYGVYGSAWTCYRTTPETPSANSSTSNDGGRTCHVLRNAGSRMQQAAAGVGVWASDWVVMAAATADLRETDLLSDGAGHVFLITAAPEIDRGCLIAPAEIGTLPS